MSERGAVSILALAGALAFCLCALGAADLGSLLIARARAQQAADAAALAAVVAQVPVLGQDADPEDEARRYAEENGGSLAGCACEPGTAFAVVEVRVRPRLVFVGGWFGREVRAVARAEVDPDVMSYRDGG